MFVIILIYEIAQPLMPQCKYYLGTPYDKWIPSISAREFKKDMLAALTFVDTLKLRPQVSALTMLPSMNFHSMSGVFGEDFEEHHNFLAARPIIDAFVCRIPADTSGRNITPLATNAEKVENSSS